MRILMMMFADITTQKGDAIRPLETARHLQALGVECVLVAESNSNHIRLALEGVNVHCIRSPKVRLLNQLLWNSFGTLAGLRLAAASKPHLVYCDAVAGSLAPWLVAKQMRLPLVVEVNGPIAGDIELYRSIGAWHVALASLTERILIQNCDAVIAAKGWAELVAERYAIAPERVVVIPLAVNKRLFGPLDKRAARKTLGLSQEQRVVIFVGNVGPWQGLETLVEAAPHVLQLMPDTQFLIVGDGVQRIPLMAMVRQAGLFHAFRFEGEVPYEQVPLYIAASDVGLSIFPPGRGRRHGVSAMKTLSYIACNRPVVVSDMDELAPQIVEYHAGVEIPAGSSSALAEALIRILADAHLRGLMEKGASHLSSHLPDWGDVARMLQSAFQRILQ